MGESLKCQPARNGRLVVFDGKIQKRREQKKIELKFRCTTRDNAHNTHGKCLIICFCRRAFVVFELSLGRFGGALCTSAALSPATDRPGSKRMHSSYIVFAFATAAVHGLRAGRWRAPKLTYSFRRFRKYEMHLIQFVLINSILIARTCIEFQTVAHRHVRDGSGYCWASATSKYRWLDGKNVARDWASAILAIFYSIPNEWKTLSSFNPVIGCRRRHSVNAIWQTLAKLKTAFSRTHHNGVN